MSRLIQQPINQVRLTNVAVVRLQLQGKRFEIACYRNKILDYRNGHESDLSEVLQSDRIFVNVSKGQFAKTSDLQKAFQTTDQEAIAKIILDHPKSAVQVSDKEREQQQADALARIATWIASHTVHPATQRPYTVAQIRQALVGYSIGGTSGAAQLAGGSSGSNMKKQCLDAFKYLKRNNILELERTKMELLLTVSMDQHEAVQSALRQLDPAPTIVPLTEAYKPPDTQTCAQSVIQLQVDPSSYRSLDQLVQTVGGRLQILQQQVTTSVGNTAIRENPNNHDSLTTSLDDDDNGASDDNDDTERRSGKSSDSQSLPEKSSSLTDLQRVEAAMAAASLEMVENENTNSDQNDSEESDEQLMLISRRQQRREQKKQSKQAKRQQHSSMPDGGSTDRLVPEASSNSAPGTLTDNRVAYSTPESNVSSKIAAGVDANTNAKRCNTCGGSFDSAAAYRAHYKSDWHRYNQKLKLQGVPPISEEEFQLCDADAFFSSDTT